MFNGSEAMLDPWVYHLDQDSTTRGLRSRFAQLKGVADLSKVAAYVPIPAH